VSLVTLPPGFLQLTDTVLVRGSAIQSVVEYKLRLLSLGYSPSGSKLLQNMSYMQIEPGINWDDLDATILIIDSVTVIKGSLANFARRLADCIAQERGPAATS
jgi:hypothetical protein